ncbi:MAG: DUF899 family protein [Bacteroidetes bacterium]|nr:DUF899 family protein [Bacteroidota bacterium]
MSMMQDTELNALYREAMDVRNRLVALLKSRAVTLDRTYVFTEGESTPVSLSALFGDKDDLIVIHNMGRSCNYCSLWADGLNGVLDHLLTRTSVVLMNADSAVSQREIAQERGWKFRMIRDTEGAFTDDMGFRTEHEGKKYLQPGYSVFHRNDDGTITRTGYDAFGPGDVYMGVFHMFDMLADGGEGWQPRKS